MFLLAIEIFNVQIRRSMWALQLAVSDDNWLAVLNIANTIVRPFALILIAVCLLIEIAQVASKVDIIKWEHGIKLGFKVALAVAFLDIAPRLLAAIYSQSMEWITAVIFDDYMEVIPHDVVEMLDRNFFGNFQSGAGSMGNWALGLPGAIGFFIVMCLFAVVLLACGLVIVAISFGRAFEIFILLAVSPLMCAFLPLGDGSGGGFSRITLKFFRQFAAACLQGFILMLCVRLFDLLLTSVLYMELAEAYGAFDVLNRIVLATIALIFTTITLCVAVVKSGSWAKSLLDAM